MTSQILIRNTKVTDYPDIAQLCQSVYPGSPSWAESQIQSHVNIFPEGQFVAVDRSSGEIVGMAASLIICWNDYNLTDNWRDFTEGGYFTNHDADKGRTLYGAEVMVDPKRQGQGIGKLLYRAREALARNKGLLRIRAGARLRGFHANRHLTPEEYVLQVVRGEVFDSTLTFQLKRGFHVLSVVSNYLRHDPESLGYAAVIEWINETIATPQDYNFGDAKFRIASKTCKLEPAIV